MEIHAGSKHIINTIYRTVSYRNMITENHILADLRTVNRGLQVKRFIFAAGFVRERLLVSLTGKEGRDGILK